MDTINIIDIVVILSVVIFSITLVVCGVIFNGEKERLRKKEPIATKILDLVQKIRLERNDIYQLSQIKQKIDNLSKELNYLPLAQKEKVQQELIKLRDKYMITKMKSNAIDNLQQTLIDYASRYLVGKPKIKNRMGYWWAIEEWKK